MLTRTEALAISPKARESWLSKTVCVLARAFDIKVAWVEHGHAPSWWDVTTRTVTLNASDPKATDPRDVHAFAKGKLYHELAHVLYTVPKPLDAILRDVGGRGTGAECALVNVLEDGRIERKLARALPGCDRYIRNVLRAFGAPTDDFGDLVRRVRHADWTYRPGSKFAPVDGLIRQALDAGTTHDVARIALDIIGRIGPMDPPSNATQCYQPAGAAKPEPIKPETKQPKQPASKPAPDEDDDEPMDADDDSDEDADGSGAADEDEDEDAEDGKGAGSDSGEDEGEDEGEGEGEDSADSDSDDSGEPSDSDSDSDSEPSQGDEPADRGTTRGKLDSDDSEPETADETADETPEQARERQAREDEDRAREDRDTTREDAADELVTMAGEPIEHEPQTYAYDGERTAAEGLTKYIEALRFDATREHWTPSSYSGRIESSRIVGAITGDQYRAELEPSAGFEFACALLVDVSGSMAGQRIAGALHAGRVLFGALKGAGIDVRVFGFGARIREWSSVPDTYPANEQHTEGEGACRVAADALQTCEAPRKLILMVTDGGYDSNPGMLGELEALGCYVVRFKIETDYSFSNRRNQCHEDHDLTGRLDMLAPTMEQAILSFAQAGAHD